LSASHFLILKQFLSEYAVFIFIILGRVDILYNPVHQL